MGRVSGAHFEDASNPVLDRSVWIFLFLWISDPNVLVDFEFGLGYWLVLAMDTAISTLVVR
jgi:hypothetical protein